MKNTTIIFDGLVKQIAYLLDNARRQIAQQVNSQLVFTYWNIGKLIVEYEQNNNIRAEYGKQTIKQLAKQLTHLYGKGFSASNLQFMRRLYQKYQKQQTLSVKLSWSHYCELLTISDDSWEVYPIQFLHQNTLSTYRKRKN